MFLAMQKWVRHDGAIFWVAKVAGAHISTIDEGMGQKYSSMTAVDCVAPSPDFSPAYVYVKMIQNFQDILT